MASTPQPKSYQSLLGGIISTFLSNVGLPRLRAGNPLLSVFEAAAQSDFRVSADIFTYLRSNSLTYSTGSALLRKGADEQLPKLGASSSGGAVTVSDTSIVKISSTVSGATPAPIAGSGSVNITDASLFPATGSIYLGRGTPNYEGPLTYSGVVNNGNYWTVTLTGTTANFHGVGESCVLAQGGNRTIPGGSLAQTAQGQAGSAIQFQTLAATTIPDGETSVQGVAVVAVLPGTSGNVAAGAISSWASPPFTGAAVTNPTSFSNGRDLESDDAYRQRIRNVRASRTQGTALAVKTAVVGAVSPDEGKTVLSSSVRRGVAGQPATLTVDDGTGYEEVSEGVGLEVLMDSAGGGEQNFTLAQPAPVTKASVTTTVTAPYALADGMVLAVAVGAGAGVVSTHTFDSSSFSDIGNATAYEICASINADPAFACSARTAGGGTGVVLSALADTDEDIQVVAAPVGTDDANSVLLFPTTKARTLSLYHNDRLLHKDGAPATVTSLPQVQWRGIGPGSMVLNVAVDGTASTQYTVTATDFISAGTGYSSVGINSLEAWVAVLNAKIPGVTAAATGNAVTLTSNLGNSSRAAVTITAANPVATNDLVGTMWAAVAAIGTPNDYVLNRNTGELQLQQRLGAEDSLSAGSNWVRAFTQTQPMMAVTTIGVGGANAWAVVDGDASVIGSGLSSSTGLYVYINGSTEGTQHWGGTRVRLVSGVSPALTLFSLVLEGDWVVIWDTNIANVTTGIVAGAYRVAAVAANGSWFEFETAATVTNGSHIGSLQSPPGVAFVRTTAALQKLNWAGGATVLAPDLASVMAGVVGAHAQTYRTTSVRLSTNSFGTGDIAIAAVDANAAALDLGFGSAVANTDAAVAGSVLAGASDAGTPNAWLMLQANNGGVGTNSISEVCVSNVLESGGAALAVPSFSSRNQVVGLKRVPDYPFSGYVPVSSYGNSYGLVSSLSTQASVISSDYLQLQLRQNTHVSWVPGDTLYEASSLALGPQDQLVVIVDGDTTSKYYDINMYRRTTPAAGSTYGNSVTLKDLTISASTSLVTGFGSNMNWDDFALYMKARVNTETAAAGAGSPNPSLDILYRYYRWGAEGDAVRLRYVYPSQPNSSIAVITESRGSVAGTITLVPPGTANASTPPTGTTLPLPTPNRDTGVNISIQLGSGAADTGTSPWTTIANTSYLGLACSQSGSAPYLYTYIFSYVVSQIYVGSATAAAITITLPSPLTDCGLKAGDTIYLSVGAGGVAAGAYSISSISGSGGGGGAPYNVINITGSGWTAGTYTPVASYVTVGNNSTTPPGLPAVVVVGHVFSVGQFGVFTTTLPTHTSVSALGYTNKTIRISATDGITYIQGYSSTDTNVDATTPTTNAVPNLNTGTAPDLNSGVFPVYAAVGNTSALQAFPLSGNTTSAIVAAVNAFPNTPVTAAIPAGVAGGTVTESTMDELGIPLAFYPLQDGVNWIASTSIVSGDYVFTLKNAPSPTLESGSDYANEELRLVPVTTAGVVAYLNQQTTSGLSNTAEVVAASRARKLQISTLTQGSSGSVEVQGGTANAVAIPVQDSATMTATAATNHMATSLRSSDCNGLSGDMWVALQNGVAGPRNTQTQIKPSAPVFYLQGVTVSADGTQALLQLNGVYALAFKDGGSTGAGPLGNGVPVWNMQVAKYGNFVAYTVVGSNNVPSNTVVAGITEGDWVYINTITVGVTGIPYQPPANCGFFRVVRSDSLSATFWVENPDAVEVEAAQAEVVALADGSILPGDTFFIPASVAGPGGHWNGILSPGAWTVVNAGLSGLGSSAGAPYRHSATQYITLSIGKGQTAIATATVPTSQQAEGVTAQVQVIENSPARLIKKVLSLAPNTMQSTLTDAIFTTGNGYWHCSSALQTSVEALDKLQFPTGISSGRDAYRHSTGLIGEANAIVYGDDLDPSTYPGVAALGANINISGPIVHRISLSLGVRIATTATVNVADVLEEVQAVVASSINALAVGQNIALADVIAAASTVTGVTSVVILSPGFGLGQDQIQIQAQEKAMVVDAADIVVSQIGS